MNIKLIFYRINIVFVLGLFLINACAKKEISITKNTNRFGRIIGDWRYTPVDLLKNKADEIFIWGDFQTEGSKTDGFIYKLDANLDIVWRYQSGLKKADIINSLAEDEEGNILAAGTQFSDTSSVVNSTSYFAIIDKFGNMKTKYDTVFKNMEILKVLYDAQSNTFILVGDILHFDSIKICKVAVNFSVKSIDLKWNYLFASNKKHISIYDQYYIDALINSENDLVIFYGTYWNQDAYYNRFTPKGNGYITAKEKIVIPEKFSCIESGNNGDVYYTNMSADSLYKIDKNGNIKTTSITDLKVILGISKINDQQYLLSNADGWQIFDENTDSLQTVNLDSSLLRVYDLTRVIRNRNNEYIAFAGYNAYRLNYQGKLITK
jgi:hypothetical protein